MHKKTYQCWQDMKQRCFNPKCHNFPNYGGRGITVCDRWLVYSNFLEDMGEKPDSLTLERINNEGNYDVSNCVWATRAAQRINQRTVNFLTAFGKTQPLRHWAIERGISESALLKRLQRGICVEEALRMPVTKRQQRFGNRNAAIASGGEG